MTGWFTPDTIRNRVLRVLSLIIFVAAQGALSNGCKAPTPTPNGDSSDNVNDNQNDNQNQNDDDASAPPLAATTEGYWISQRIDGGTTLRGLGQGTAFDQDQFLDIREDDGGSWSFSGAWDGAVIRGTCSPSLSGDNFDINDLFDDPDECVGTFSEDGRMLTLSGGDRQWMLQRSFEPSPSLIGEWTDAKAGAFRRIMAFDGRLLNVLDPDDAQATFTAVWDDNLKVFSGTTDNGYQWRALVEADQQLFVWIEEFSTFIEQQSLQRQGEPSVLDTAITGRWMSSQNNGENTVTVRGQASLIFDGTNLYVHQRDDDHRVLFSSDYNEGGYWSVLATYDGRMFTSTDESGFQWSGTLDPTGQILHGYWNGDRARRFGFAKVASTDDLDLTAEWSSVSTDYQTPSDPAQTIGQSVVSFDGANLLVEGTTEDGTEFVIEAAWKGDHFVGEWYPADDPTNRLIWTGEVVLDGGLLHGKWELGEWSFTPYQATARNSLGDIPSGTLAVITNPLDEIAAVYRDDEAGMAVTVLQEAGVIARLDIVSEAGKVQMTVDERFRPTTISGSDLQLQLNWADDSSTVSLAITINGETTLETVALDLSDTGIVAAIDEIEPINGLDASVIRSWIAANPGRFARVMRGEEAIGSLNDPFAKSSLLRPHAKPKVATTNIARRVLGDGFTIASAAIFAVQAGAFILKIGTITTLTIAASAVMAIAAVGAVVLIALLIWDFLLNCDPCTLACFYNCDLDDPPSSACCMPSGVCVMLSQSTCTSFNGTFYGGQACDTDTCGPLLPVRACCMPDGSCQEANNTECTIIGGLFLSSFDCADASPCAAP